MMAQEVWSMEHSKQGPLICSWNPNAYYHHARQKPKMDPLKSDGSPRSSFEAFEASTALAGAGHFSSCTHRPMDGRVSSP